MQDRYMEYVQAAADAADSKKANDVIVLDIRGLSVIADYFVICSANSRTQVQAVASAVKERVEELGLRCKAVEGKDEAKWVLLDFGDLVVHVFIEEERRFFGLERLWGDAPRLSVSV